MKSHMINKHNFKLCHICEVTFSGVEQLKKHLDNDHLRSTFLQHNFLCLYPGQSWAIEAMQVTTGGPDTHFNPHQRGAVRTVASPLFWQNFFQKLSKVFQFLICKSILSCTLYFLFIFIPINKIKKQDMVKFCLNSYIHVFPKYM